MAIRKSQPEISVRSPFSPKADLRSQAKRRLRHMLLEQLEQRQLLAVGPQLIGIQPNSSELLVHGDVRTEAPRELVFRFDDSQFIDPATLSGIRITSAGSDGSFGINTAQSDFGSSGGANIQLNSVVPGQTWNVTVNQAVLAAGTPPAIAVTGSEITITLNSNPAGRTTAAGLISAINGSGVLAGKLTAQLNGGLGTAPLGLVAGSSYSPIAVNRSGDTVLQPGAVLVGQNPNENEVTFRFAQTLKDDNYRIEIFGFDDPLSGVVGLRNKAADGVGDLFIPSTPGTRKDTLDFRLDLGPQVTAVVPQPVTRVGGQLQQQRDTVVVYFDADKLLVENNAAGQPTSRSVENPAFYQLIFTRDTVRNTDDTTFLPTSVKYNAAANTATLKFATDLNDLMGSGAGPATFRLRIGTRETTPTAPTRSEATANAITDLNTGGAVKLRLTSRQVGEMTSDLQVAFVNSGSGSPQVSVAGTIVTVDLGRNNLTAQELVDLLRNSSAAANLLSVSFEPGSTPSTVVGNTNLAFSPVKLVGLGSSFDTATNLGVIGSSGQGLTSLVLSSAIDPQSFLLDLPGASSDAAHRDLVQNLVGGFEDHVDPAFGPDATDGITTIYYNFRQVYAQSNSAGVTLNNAISPAQKARAREVLSLWASYIGVQFVETADLGVTIAAGPISGIAGIAGTTYRTEANFGVRIDPTFQNSLIVLPATNTFNTEYGADYTRNVAAAVGMVLGLQHAGDLPETTLMRLDPTFLAGSGSLSDPNAGQLNASDEKYEPILPGNQDILHARHLYRPDGSDIDLYRFEVDFGNSDRVGILTAETYAQRLTNSSQLNTHLELFRQKQATASTTFGASVPLSLQFEAVRSGAQGNQLQVFFTQTERGDASKPIVLAFPNALSIDLNATAGSESTVQDVIDAINNSPAASGLVRVSLVTGSANTKVGDNVLTQNPVTLSGGGMELVSQNDDYFSDDSLLTQSLTTGVYYIGVSASGNDNYNASISGTGFGGQSQGNYDLRITFRAEVDTSDTIQDIVGSAPGSVAVGLDGDSDGVPGGTYDFWFQTRPLQRSLSFNAGATAALEGRTITLIGASGSTQTFEFSSDTAIGAGRVRIPYTNASTAGELASALAIAINSRGQLNVGAVANGVQVVLTGERSIIIDPAIKLIDVSGKTIFVDKAAGPNADGSLAKPFNNISGSGVPNAFASTFPGDIVRIVGNGGGDNNLATEADNFAYEIGTGLLPGSILSDGATMDIPQGVTTMIDAGAVFKLRGAHIGVGSSNLSINRSGSALQVLGAPLLLDAAGNALRKPTGMTAEGRVYFTSWLDESIGLDTYTPTTSPTAGNWGGISFRRDVDNSAGRPNLEDQGIFLQYVNHADIRYGGGTVTVESIPQTVFPVQMIDMRPTITDNRITRSSSAAISAAPNSFEETNFNEPRFQLSGSFTSDYDRVGPEIRRNTLLNNSINGLFIRVDTAGLTVPGRFDDTDIVHVITDNIIVHGAPGGSLLDSTTPPVALVSLGADVGGRLLPGFYSYKVTYVDRNGYESVPSAATATVELQANQTAVSIAGLPTASGDFIERRLYRSQSTGQGPYDLVAKLDRTTSTFLDLGQSPGGTLLRDRADVAAVTLSTAATGALPAGRYSYRIVMVDAGGREGLASEPTSIVNLTATGSTQLSNLPATLPGYSGRRIYRSSNGGTSPYVLVADLQDATSAAVSSFSDSGATLGRTLPAESLGIKRPRLNASLVIDPGTVLKLEASRIEATFGANVIAEGTDGKPIVFTSKLDDTVGAGGTFDTNNNGASTGPAARDWGGIYVGPTAQLSVDYARFAYGGGVTKLDSTFRAFNTIEVHQGEARIAHTLFENNADGFGGQGPGTRLGRLSNEPSTIFVRGAQPVLIANEFRGNTGSAITIDTNSMVDDIMPDPGRQTGAADRNPSYLSNRGPLIRDNRFVNNGLNGLKLRGDTLTTASVWDDTDIVHVVYNEIFTGNVQHEGGLRLQSAPNESLVVKFDGYGSNFNRNLGAGLTANGQLTSATDRVGGSLYLVGQPGFPVILTSLRDDTVGAGLRPDGKPQNDTNNDGIGSIPQAADWRGVLLDQYSNDRNVALVPETESLTAAAPGPNGRVTTAQVLGNLARNRDSGDENNRLGFVIPGVLSQSEDVDVFSFTGTAGAEVWLDVDYTQANLDMVLELLDANGQLLARSDNSTAEAVDPSLLFVSNLIPASSVNPLATRTVGARMTSSGAVKEDGTTNPLDPGLRVRLPGSPGNASTYFVRVRSAGTNVDAVGAGLTSGTYELQVRLREQQEWAGSTINYADIRYAMNGIHLRGLPSESPLIGEAAEDESVRNGQLYANNGVATGGGVTTGGFGGGGIGFLGNARVGQQLGNRPQFVGNLLSTSKGAISVAGNISSGTDVDFYMLQINQEDIVGSLNGGNASVVFDMDYADGLNRPDTSINIFKEEPSQFGNQYRLIFSSDSSNIADDQGRPLSISDMEDLSRGSVGTKDPYIGPVALPQGNYLVGISSAAYQPRTKIISPADVAPINSIRRLVDESFNAGVTTAAPPVVRNFLPRTNVGASGELISKTFDLGAYAAADLPAIYLNYTQPAGTNFEIFVKDSNGDEFAIASSTDAGLARLLAGTNSLKLSLGNIQARPAGGGLVTKNFAGENGLSLIFRADQATTNINSIIIGFGERGESVGVGDEPILLQSGNIFAPSGAAVPPFVRGAPGSWVATRSFSLASYSAFVDRPQIAFDYEIFNGQMDVFIIDEATGIETRIATSVNQNNPPNFPLLTVGSPQSAVLNIANFAGRDRLRVEFRARNDDPSRAAIRNAVIQLADGSRVNAGEPNSTYVGVPVPSTTVTTGNYQLEIRLGEQYFQSRSFGAPLLTKSFDTNDRHAEQISLIAPAGNLLTTGDKFSISDGGRAITFEFTTTGVAALGNVPVRFTAADPAHVVARAIRDAINSSGVQSQLQGTVRAATSSGIVSGTAGRDTKIDLHGPAAFKSLVTAIPAGAVKVVIHEGNADRNVRREQSQVIIQNSFIRESRDYGVWSEPAARLADPRDQLDSFTRTQMQNIPNLAGTQAVRNLLQPNSGVQGGMLPGLVIQNNVLEEGGLGGINVQGESPIWMLSPRLIPYFEPGTDPAGFLWDGNPLVNTSGANPPISHFGSYIDDQDTLVIDADRTRVRLEFDDLAGGGTGNPVAGSGQVEGNGTRVDSALAWYRDTGGDFYQRLTGGSLAPFATTAFETVHALRDSLLASILVSNGTTQTVNVTVAESLLGPDPVAPVGGQFGYPLYFNRPAVYLEGATTLQWQDGPNGNSTPFDIRQLDLGEVPQPQAKIINNTIIGTDGRASFNGETALKESNDTIADAVQTWQGTAHNPLLYSDVGVIGDGGQAVAGGLSSTPSSGTGGGGAGGGNNVITGDFVPAQLILSFNAGVSEQQQTAILNARGLTVSKRFDFIGAMLVQGNESLNVANAVDELTALPQVKYAEPNYLTHIERTPNDPRFSEQWGFSNTGQTGGTAGADIGLTRAWDTFTGSSNTVIAVIDSGVDYNHPDLRANMWVNPGEIAGDRIDNDGNGYIDDIHGIDPGEGDSDPMDNDGHGTHVAGTTSAVGNNGIGVNGVNWNAKIMALKGTDALGGLPNSATIEALNYMVTMKTKYGINVVVSNNSYGGRGFSQASMDAIAASINVGIPFVASAGNSATDNDLIPHYPDGYDLDGIISVAATNDRDQLGNFSQFGSTTVDVAAPGVAILSTTLGGGYGLLQGTSMASPHVAGVVALLAGAVPGASVGALKSAVLVGADPIQGLSGTSVTGARLNAAKSLVVMQAGLSGTLSATDVDIYQFKLGVGERAIVDIDSSGSGLDSVLQIFNSRGIAQTFVNANGVSQTTSDNDAAPGEILGLDSYADFTALEPGVYYAAVSSTGNTSYDPLSLANRQPGTTTGAYRISISARHLQDFVITAENASAYAGGETFTIYGVPDIDSTGSPGRTFEFVIGQGNASNANHIPINIDPAWRYPDVARAIAKAVNEGGPNRGRAISNSQLLPNDIFGLASPLPPVHAKALGGISAVLDAPFNTLQGDKETIIQLLSAVDELGSNQLSQRQIEQQIFGPYYQVNQGLELFPRRFDGVITTVTTTLGGIGTFQNISSLSHLGIGHDRLSTQPISFTSRGDGTTEKFIVISNAAWIDGNGAIIVDPDESVNNNLDQLLPETGVLASRGASPTVLNNVFFNLQTPVILEESRVNLNTGVKAPYGTPNPNVVSKPGDVVLGGSVYQYYETASARSRFTTGIEAAPTNIPNTALDQNFDAPNGTRLFVNAQAGEYLPAPGSPLIDSAINKLNERPSLVAVKTAMGLPTSDVLAPDYDLVGQLRADDPAVSPPGGTGQNVFKDRGAFDRADFIGPAAILLNPIDNDALGIDRDGSDSVVQLVSGVFPEFRIQLADGNEPANPLRGVGIDDNTVVSSVIPDKRLGGAAVAIFENGRLLQEGIDYSFAYNATRDEIILTPLAGVWKNGQVYEISVNNKDRFVITAPSGDQVADGDRFSITDADGGVVVYEFDSGFRLQVPQGLTLQVPLAGGAFGGIADGDRFSLTVGSNTTTFEFDSNGNILAGSRRINFVPGASQQEIVNALIAEIQAANLTGITPIQQAAGKIFIGAEAGVQLNTNFSTLSQPNSTLAFRIPASGPRGGILEGHTFTLNDGRMVRTFEYDTDNSVAGSNVPINFASAVTAQDIANLTRNAIASSGLNLNPTVVAGTLIHLGLGPTASASVNNSQLTLVGVARTLADGERFTITGNGKTATFELTRDATVAAGNIAISVSPTDSQNAIANRIVSAIIAADLGLTPKAVGEGNISIGGTVNNSVDASGAPGLTLFGRPGVQSKTQLQVFGPLVLQVPPVSSLIDNSTISLQGNGRTVVFEFDGNGSGVSAAGNVVVPFTALNSSADVANALAAAINAAGLNITATSTSGGRINLGRINASQILLGSSGLTVTRGVVTDGEKFSISNGTRIVTFEFDNVDLNNGFTSGNTPILFSNSTTPETLVQTMKAAIEAAGLGLTTTILAGASLQLNDTPRFSTDVSSSPTLIKSGVPGGSNAVQFIQDPSFTGVDMKRAIIDAINASADTSLVASDRGGSSLFVSQAAIISPEIESFFLRGVADLAGNLLKPNRINNETEFTILMPGVALDYGDAPDPLSTTSGRYPTTYLNDGARHVVGNVALLGSGISADADGQPTPTAAGDTLDDGVVFGSILATPGIFNRHSLTPVTVTLSSPGFVDGWIDFNGDGDWQDPGEQILTSARFSEGNLTQTFMVTVPATTPVATMSTQTFARFRSSSSGGLIPTGLTVDGEVEDYAVTIAPGTPPTAVNDSYTFNEDSAAFTTTDPSGTSTPGFTIDDGVAANDSDPDGGPLGVSLVSGPSFARPGSFALAANGTFTYRPVANFNGSDTFVYRVNDGVLGSNNLGTVTLIVREVNDAPTAVNDTQTIDEGATLDIDQSVLLNNDRPGPDNESTQTLTITSVDPTSARGGSVTLVAGRIRYVPPANFSGQDSFNYVVTDNGTTAGVPAPLSATATLTININDRNSPPITVGKTLAATEDTPATISETLLLAGDQPGPADEAGQTLTITGVNPDSTHGGTVTFANGIATYTPAADFEGTDTFFYQVRDNGTSGGVADPRTATGTVTVTVAGTPDAPRIMSSQGTISMAEDEAPRIVNLTSIFFDPDAGDTLTFTIPAGGNSNPTLVNPTVSSGLLTLTLQPDQNGTATIVVRATDSTNRSVEETVTLTVGAVNDPPRLLVSLADLTVNEDDVIAPITLSPTHFFDPDVATNGDVLTFEVVGNTNPLLVTPTISGNQLRLVLTANRSGFSDVRVSAKDASGQTVISQFRLTVNDVNDVPVTQPDSYRVRQGQSLIVNDPDGSDSNANNNGVLANDHDPEGAAITAQVVTPPQNALSFVLNANGTFTYQHDFNKGKATDSFSYRASDGSGQSVVTTVTITIDNPPPPPHQNPVDHMDVNADGFVSPVDALLIINLINERGGGIPTSSLPPAPPYRDVDGNNIISANDVLQVINFLNSRSGLSSGEGEAAEWAIGQLDVTAATTAEGLAYPSQMVISAATASGLSLVPVAGEELTAERAHSRTALTSSQAVFDQLGGAATDGVDISWVDQQAEDSDRNQPIDLALASLLDELEDRFKN